MGLHIKNTIPTWLYQRDYTMVQLLFHKSYIDREKSLNNIHTYIHTNKHDLSPFSIACWTPASRLRCSASVWKSDVSFSRLFRNVIAPVDDALCSHPSATVFHPPGIPVHGWTRHHQNPKKTPALLPTIAHYRRMYRHLHYLYHKPFTITGTLPATSSYIPLTTGGNGKIMERGLACHVAW